jgi:hypothetical protein
MNRIKVILTLQRINLSIYKFNCIKDKIVLSIIINFMQSFIFNFNNLKFVFLKLF